MRRILRKGDTSVRFGSLADPHDISKAAVRAAGIGGIADLAIHQRQPFMGGKYRETTRALEWQVLARSFHPERGRAPRTTKKLILNCVREVRFVTVGRR